MVVAAVTAEDRTTVALTAVLLTAVPTADELTAELTAVELTAVLTTAMLTQPMIMVVKLPEPMTTMAMVALTKPKVTEGELPS